MGGVVPATPHERVAAVRAELVASGIGGAAAQGVPLTQREGFAHALAAVLHFLPDAAERRALCRQMADDLRSMILISAVDFDEVDDVLGVTPQRLSAAGVPHRAWAPSRALADDAKWLARDVALGEGPYLDRWAADDAYVADALAVLFVVFTRLAV